MLEMKWQIIMQSGKSTLRTMLHLFKNKNTLIHNALRILNESYKTFCCASDDITALITIAKRCPNL